MKWKGLSSWFIASFFTCFFVPDGNATSWNMSIVGQYDDPVPYSTYHNSVRKIGDFAYLSDNTAHSLLMIDVSNPALPTVHDTLETGGRQITWIYPHGSTAIVNFYDFPRGIASVNVADPSTPVLGGSVATGNQTMEGIECYGIYGYSRPQMGYPVKVFDLSNAMQPAVVDSFTTVMNPSVLRIHNGYGYYMETDVGLHILDFTDPTSPLEVGTWNGFTNPVMEMAISGNILYAVTQYSGIKLVDISNPAAPVLLSTIPLSESLHPSRISIDGNYIGVVFGYDGIKIWDVSNPGVPLLAAYYDEDLDIRDLVLEGTTAYAACQINFVIFDFSAASVDHSAPTVSLPAALTVSPAYPNPFNPSVTVPFTLNRPGQVVFSLFDITGRLVGQESMLVSQGSHTHTINLNSIGHLSSGEYILQVQNADALSSQKIMFVK